jgi:putative membrane protein
MDKIEPERDPRLYMAAERTYLAWLRTGIALMGFGFVVARFALFLRELVSSNPSLHNGASGLSLPLGIALIVLGMVVNVVAGVRHSRYIRAIDRNEFRSAFGSSLAYLVGGILAAIGLVMSIYLAKI